MKILMLRDYTYRIHSGKGTLYKGKAYETEGWQNGYYNVHVSDRDEPVKLPEYAAKIIGAEAYRPNAKTEAGKGGVQIPIKDLQHFSRPESDHYHTGNVDVWKFADENFSEEEVRGFHRIDAIKYLTRYGKKNGFNRKDLEKAIAEINKLLEIHDKGEWK